MDDNYFDQKLKDLLDSAPPFQPDSNVIDDMKKRLQFIRKSKKKEGTIH